MRNIRVSECRFCDAKNKTFFKSTLLQQFPDKFHSSIRKSLSIDSTEGWLGWRQISTAFKCRRVTLGFRGPRNLRLGARCIVVDRESLTLTCKMTYLLSWNKCWLNAWFNFTCYHPPPGNPGDKSSPSVPGVGNCLKPSCPGGRGRGKSKITSCCSCEVRHLIIGWRRTAWRRLPISSENR